MKACFYLQRRFAYIGHEMAKLLKEQYGITEFSGYVEQRASLKFLQDQTDIKYQTLLLDEEIIGSYANEPLDVEYIKNIGKKIWPTKFMALFA